MSDDIESTTEYAELLESIKHTLASARIRAARAVNNILIETYWEVGQDIGRRRAQSPGAQVIERLSADLRAAHPGTRGLSPRNLEYMAVLATRWPDGIAGQAVARLPWGHVTTLLDASPDRATSEFYAQRAAAEGWTTTVLQAMIVSRLHERVAPSLTTVDRAVPEADREVVKDPFILDFLTGEPLPERNLRKALTANVTQFLQEQGAGFALLGAEVPIRDGDREFRVDLLFYHCRLHRYVVFELKVGAPDPDRVGALNFYVELVDEQLTADRDEPALGILLVAGRDDVTVEVTLRGISTPLAVSEWRKLPEDVRQALPSAEGLARTVARARREVANAVLANAVLANAVLAHAQRPELHADPRPGCLRRLRDGVVPGALAAASHHDQVAVPEFVSR